MTTTLPSSPPVKLGGAVIYGSKDPKQVAGRQRAVAAYVALASRIEGAVKAQDIEAAVENAIQKENEMYQLKAQKKQAAAQAKEDAAAAAEKRKPKEIKVGPQTATPAGNCAEWLEFAS